MREKKYSKQRDEHTHRLLSGKGFSIWSGMEITDSKEFCEK